MIKYNTHFLSNGLQLIVHEDRQTPMVCLNLLYRVGSRNERPDKTGFAHLFEHLMFGGSANIANFDTPLQNVGGENNAFTSPDITNYYITVPSNNIETAFWLESDRMMSLAFNQEILDVQRKVVVEEFKQRYLNQPYGDVWLKLRPMAYKVHPYQWATIGKEISHIENATMDDVKTFFGQHYHPGNAILVIAGDISEEKALKLTEKWFGPIAGKSKTTLAVTEPTQSEVRKDEVKADVPANAIYKVFHMSGRIDRDYYATDLLADILGRGTSSLLHQKLVKQKPVFSSISAYVMGSADPGLLTISGKVMDGVNPVDADAEIQNVLDLVAGGSFKESDLEKVKNQVEATLVYSETELLNKAMGLAYAAFLGNSELVNAELEMVRAVDKEQVVRMAGKVLRPENSSSLYYYSSN